LGSINSGFHSLFPIELFAKHRAPCDNLLLMPNIAEESSTREALRRAPNAERRTLSAIPGQRWVSDSEPELGLGIILQAASGRVSIFFPAANEHRQYALSSAPLRRVEFKEGDRIKTQSGATLIVETVEEQNGLLFYRTTRGDLPEAELSDTISFSTPQERLLGGQIDDLGLFALRVEALKQRSRLRQSPVRGFVGGRVDLIPHQLSIASEVASRLVPRVLLADEVGLGKTIEACLILHRLHLTGRAGRVLILVPESLVHQWFVELLRRFNLLFSLFDEERCAAIQLHDPEANPFLDSQLVLCSVDLLANSPARAEQAIAAGWDLLIVDEAHHLAWTPDSESPQYSVVKTLSEKVSGLLLLTATPQQLGLDGHFARLHLLDRDRYPDLDRFRDEAEQYGSAVQSIEKLIAGKPLARRERQQIGDKSKILEQRIDELKEGDDEALHKLVIDLIDQFGTGRVMFRNSRAALNGFPSRKAHLAPLNLDKIDDPFLLKIKWLAALLKKLRDAKVLLICRTRELAERISNQLQAELNVKCALFHEHLTLLQRDRNAAFFSEEEGARVLICSEIGSEGRNFQFAHHLVLFDLPDDPELLEQRIGRLDRIGQTSTIHVYIPYLEGTESEVIARWYDEGLNAFSKNLSGASQLAEILADDLAALRTSFNPEKLEQFLKRSREERVRIARQLEKGHDRLLALNTAFPEQAQKLIDDIRLADSDESFAEFFLRMVEQFGVQIEDLGNRSYLLHPSDGLTDALPSLPPEGLTVTFDRTRALSREEHGFMSGDHPLVRGAIDLLLGSESGNAAYGVWENAGKEAILLEIFGVVESVAPSGLHADRFLPATPIRIAVDHTLTDQTADEALASAQLEKGDLFGLLDRGVVRRKFIPAMLEKAQELASEKMTRIIGAADFIMNRQLQGEIERLQSLRETNDHIRPEEIAALQQQKEALTQAINAAHLRLDAVRLIFARA
jgi:ATP-dependent helicase HepA